MLYNQLPRSSDLKKHIKQNNLHKEITKRRIYWTSAVICAILWSWLYIVDVGRLANIALVAYFTITLVMTIIVSISALIFTYAILYLRNSYKRNKDYKWVFKAVFIWAFAEAFVAWAVAFMWMGKNGSVDNILPFSTLTPFIVISPLKYISRFVGFYGLSSVVMVGIALLVKKELRKYALPYWSILIVLSAVGWYAYRVPSGAKIKTTIVSEQLGEAKQIETDQSKLIITPEYGLDDFSIGSPQKRFADSNHNYYYIGSRQDATSTGHKNVLVFGSRDHGFIKEQDKNRLIVGGEHLSFWVEGMLRIISPTTVSDFQVRRAVVKGNNNIELFAIDDGVVVGSAVCSSIIAPEDYRHFANKGASMLTNSASLEIFKGSRLFNWQHRGFAKFMAVANARPFLQSSNNWQAFAIDKDGNQLTAIDPSNTQLVNVQTNHNKTLYTYVGEWLVYVGIIIVVYDIYKYRRKISKLYN